MLPVWRQSAESNRLASLLDVATGHIMPIADIVNLEAAGFGHHIIRYFLWRKILSTLLRISHLGRNPPLLLHFQLRMVCRMLSAAPAFVV